MSAACNKYLELARMAAIAGDVAERAIWEANSPMFTAEHRAGMAIHALSTAVTDMYGMAGSATGRDLLRRDYTDLAALRSRLGNLLNLIGDGK